MDRGDIERALRQMFGGQQEMEPVGTLNQKDLKEWQELNERGMALEAEKRELTARRELFWARLRKANPSLRDRDSIQIEAPGIVMATKEKAVNAPPDLPIFPEMPADME